LLKFIDFSALDECLLSKYRNAFKFAFPDIILHSEVVKNAWKKVETYFPEFQRILVGPNSDLIGFVNTLPMYWDQSLKELPDEGWDWLMQKGISDYENEIRPNCLGGLQIVISKNYLGNGLSKDFIAEAKSIKEKHGFENFVLPIRPTFKKKHPHVKMQDYMQLKKNNQIYDPWIRTHLKSGAKIIKVCSNSMNVQGGISFWESLMDQKITQSGYYEVEGALNLISIDFKKNSGEYREENIWINYS
jgi:hypothetical protein